MRKYKPAPSYDELEWQNEAACNGKPSNLFFTRIGRDRDMDFESGLLGKDLYCNATPMNNYTRCPVRDQCLNHAINYNEQYGIWGGMTTQERKRYVKERLGT